MSDHEPVDRLEYSPAHVARLTGVATPTLHSWARIGFLDSSVQQSTGTGHHRAYSFTDLVLVTVAHRLRRHTVSLDSIRPLLDHIRSLPTLTTLPYGFAVSMDEQGWVGSMGVPGAAAQKLDDKAQIGTLCLTTRAADGVARADDPRLIMFVVPLQAIVAQLVIDIEALRQEEAVKVRPKTGRFKSLRPAGS